MIALTNRFQVTKSSPAAVIAKTEVLVNFKFIKEDRRVETVFVDTEVEKKRTKTHGDGNDDDDIKRVKILLQKGQSSQSLILPPSPPHQGYRGSW